MSEVRQPAASDASRDALTAADRAEQSSRWVVLLMLWAGAKWLVLATLLGLLTSLKFHGPGILADTSWLTYGRVEPAFWNALLYGFALQTGLGVGLWILTRVGRAELTYRGIAIAGIALWNIGVTVGLVGILAGDSTGHPWLEIPGYASPLLVTGYALLGMCLLGTFRGRFQAELGPSQWFLLAAVFWFAWIYSVAQILLVAAPVRGVMQPIVAWWFEAQFLWLCLGFLGLASLWYWIPRLVERPLFSRYHALLAFWLLVLFTGWRGIPASAPVPAWLPGISTVFAVLSVVPVLAIALNLHHTLAGKYREAKNQPALLLAVFAALAYVVAMGLGIVQRLPFVSTVTDLTFWTPGVQGLFLYGFVGGALLAAAYGIVPRLLSGAFPSSKWTSIQVWSFVSGAVIHSLPLILGGVAQGQALNQAELPFMEAFKPGLMALRLSTLGDLLLLGSSLLLAVRFGAAFVRQCRQCCEPWVIEALKPEPVEVEP